MLLVTKLFGIQVFSDSDLKTTENKPGFDLGQLAGSNIRLWSYCIYGVNCEWTGVMYKFIYQRVDYGFVLNAKCSVIAKIVSITFLATIHNQSEQQNYWFVNVKPVWIWFLFSKLLQHIYLLIYFDIILMYT